MVGGPPEGLNCAIVPASQGGTAGNALTRRGGGVPTSKLSPSSRLWALVLEKDNGHRRQYLLFNNTFKSPFPRISGGDEEGVWAGTLAAVPRFLLTKMNYYMVVMMSDTRWSRRLEKINRGIFKKIIILAETPHGIEEYQYRKPKGAWMIYSNAILPSGNVHSAIGLGIQPPTYNTYGDMYIHMDRNDFTEPYIGTEVAYIEGSMYGSWALNFWFKDKRGRLHRFTKPAMDALVFYMEYHVKEDILKNIRVGITHP